MTMTVTMRARANWNSCPRISQAASVVNPTLRAITVSHRAARLARSWVRERLSWALRTISITCDR